MNTPLEIHTVFSYKSRLGAGSLIFGLFALFVALGTRNIVFGLVCLSPLFLISAMYLLAERSRPIRIVIDPLRNEIVTHYHSWSGKAPRTWRLERWNAVQSYLTTESLSNLVALRASDLSSDVLPISDFSLTSEAKSPLSLPKVIEAPEAAELRKKLVATGLFKDRGFSAIEIAGRYVT